MDSISVFEIIKIGIGPSSSHTMGPWRASRSFLKVLEKDNKIDDVSEIISNLYGSLAKTGIGHGTDISIMLGLSGENFETIDTDEISIKIQNIKENGYIQISNNNKIKFNYSENILFHYDKVLDEHPNGMMFTAIFKDGSIFSKEYFSVGGGFIVPPDFDYLPKENIEAKYPCNKAQDIYTYCSKMNLRISEFVLLNEMTWRSEKEIRERALNIWEEIKKSVFRGIKKTGVLPGGLNVRRRAYDLNKKLLWGKKFSNVDEWLDLVKSSSMDFATITKWVSVFALAINEENASFGRIITAPTNGASGVIPAVLLYAYCFTPNFGDDEIINFIITAGEIGTLYKKRATISGAMGGCQAEIGVSSSMAAAALTETLGGRKEQVFQAAEIAMEHHLGLTCDPIGGLVQIPCIERNFMGAIKAISAAVLALESDSFFAKVSLDDIIKTMRETAKDMSSKYKETSEGGLALIPVNISEC